MRIQAEDAVVVYTADSSYQEAFIPFSKGADLLIAESNFTLDKMDQVLDI